MSDDVSRIRDLRRRRLSPAARALLDELDASTLLSPDGRDDPPSDELLECMLELAPSDRHELAAILGEMALAARKHPRQPDR